MVIANETNVSDSIAVRFVKPGDAKGVFAVLLAEGSTVNQAIEATKTEYATRNGGRQLETQGYAFAVNGQVVGAGKDLDGTEEIEDGDVLTLVGNLKAG